jgi:hypothetical protein
MTGALKQLHPPNRNPRVGDCYLHIPSSNPTIAVVEAVDGKLAQGRTYRGEREWDWANCIFRSIDWLTHDDPEIVWAAYTACLLSGVNEDVGPGAFVK